MKNQDEQIDKLFQQGLGNYEETPSSSAWDSIDSQLPKRNTRSIYWVAASIVAVLLTSTIVWNSILEKSNTFTYETANAEIKANFPQKEFIPLPILIHTNTVVYIEREVFIKATESPIQTELIKANNAIINPSFDLKPISDYYALSSNISEAASVELVYAVNEPITIIYKKGDPKHPMLAKAANFFKEVGEGERPLKNIEKISTGVLARRETTNNSNN